MRPKLELVTSDKARSWLVRSRQERLNMAKARKIIAAIRHGQWNPDAHAHRPLIIRGGAAADGNHRLFSVLVLDQAVEMWVLHEPG